MKAFNTILASVVAGAMTIGVASIANDKAAAKTKAPAKKEAKKDGHKEEHKAAAGEHKGEDHKCGEGKCGDKKDEHHE